MTKDYKQVSRLREFLKTLDEAPVALCIGIDRWSLDAFRGEEVDGFDVTEDVRRKVQEEIDRLEKELAS